MQRLQVVAADCAGQWARSAYACYRPIFPIRADKMSPREIAETPHTFIVNLPVVSVNLCVRRGHTTIVVDASWSTSLETVGKVAGMAGGLLTTKAPLLLAALRHW